MALGIDVTPKKTCSYNCVYCQIGKNENTKTLPISGANVDTVIFELKKHLHQYKNVDYITFAGSGEPTLYGNIKQLIAEINNTTDIPVCIITNGSLFYKQEIRSSILNADIVIPSLDAGCEDTFKKINQPNYEINFDSMVAGLIEFSRVYKGSIWLEVFIISGINDNEKEMSLIAGIVAKMRIEKLQLLTADRPMAYKEYSPVSYDRLVELSKCFDSLKGNCEVEVLGKPNYQKYGDRKDITENDILALLQRHPTTESGIAMGLGSDIEVLRLLITKLLEENKIKEKEIDGSNCYYVV